MFSSFSKKVIYLTSAYSQFGENLSKGCPEQRKTLSLGQLPVYLRDGYHWALLGFISFGELLSSHPGYFTAWGSLFSYKLLQKELPFPRNQVTKYLSSTKRTSSFYFNSGSPCPSHAHVPIGMHIHPTKAVDKHTQS